MIAAAERRERRAIALATLTVVVAAGILGRQHEAEVAHVTDARTGITSHALESECHDTETVLVSHFHAMPSSDHADACEQTAAVHQPVQHADQPFHVGHVQAHGGLVEHVQRVGRLLPPARHVVAHRAQLGHQLDALRLAAAERG